jgi:hypothetical protein
MTAMPRSKKPRGACAAEVSAFESAFEAHMQHRIKEVDILSQSVANLITNHLDIAGVVNVRRFTQTVCDRLHTFAGSAQRVSLTDLHEFTTGSGGQTTSEGSAYLFTIPRTGARTWLQLASHAAELEDPLLRQLQQQEQNYMCSEGLMDERTWFSAMATGQMQCHAARTITAACAHRFNLCTFVFCKDMSEFNDATKRLLSQFSTTLVPVLEFLVGYAEDLPQGSFTQTAALRQGPLRDMKHTMELQLEQNMVRAGIVVILCEVAVLRNFEKMLDKVVSDRLGVQEADGAANQKKAWLSYCVVVPSITFKDRDMQRIMDQKFLGQTSTNAGAVFTPYGIPYVVIDLAQE